MKMMDHGGQWCCTTSKVTVGSDVVQAVAKGKAMGATPSRGG